MHSPSRPVANAIVDGTRLTLVLDDDAELHWRHHDPVRLRRILDLVPSKRVAYPSFHALRVGPYWFNCAPESEDWQDCRLPQARRAGVSGQVPGARSVSSPASGPTARTGSTTRSCSARTTSASGSAHRSAPR